MKRPKKIVKTGAEVREGLTNGINILADAVKSTLGPGGKTVILDKGFGRPVVTKDGVSVAKSIYLEDSLENLGVEMLKEVSSKTNDEVGDGTTTATVLAQQFLKKGNELLEKGENSTLLKKGINTAVDDIVSELKEISRPVGDSLEILKRVATISANNDEEIGEIISTAYRTIGKDGIITVEESGTSESEIEVLDGIKIDKGYTSPYFCTNPDKMTVEYQDPKILFYNGRVNSFKDLITSLEEGIRKSLPIVIIADEFDTEVLNGLILNRLKGGMKICAIKSPGFGGNRGELLEDLAILTGGILISPEKGDKLESAGTLHFGTCKKLLVTKNTTTIIGGKGTKEEIEKRVETIREQIKVEDSEYNRERLRERLAQFSGGVAVIKIGAGSELEMKEKRDRVDDALSATRAAVEEGIVPGGGTAFLYIQKKLKKKEGNSSFEKGYNLVLDSLDIPFLTILKNADLDIEKVKKEWESSDFLSDDVYHVYDILREKIEGWGRCLLSDPLKVTRIALENAASVTGTILTTDSVVIDITEEENDNN